MNFTLWNERLVTHDRLGVHCTQAKVNMGPVENIHMIQLDFERVFVDFGHHIFSIIGTQGLGNLTHMRKPLDVRLGFHIERFDKLGRVGHLLFFTSKFFMPCHRRTQRSTQTYWI
jgi:hypothetical protein